MLIVQLMLIVGLTAGCSGVRWRDVKTTHGLVRGYLVGPSEAPYYAYRGIYYARATNRFKAPKPAHRWDGTFEATYQIKCPQPNGSGTEDCLVLNVFSQGRASGLPVLVLVHDGNFQTGRGAPQPPLRLLERGLVIVTFNYRLGALGFLCLGTSEAPGNAGLKDQVAALYWVQKNIENFGGNPSDVTVYGIGSGASSIQLILLSGAGQGLIHKAILESGSALSPLSLSYDPLSTAFDAAIAMGYTGVEDARHLGTFYKELSIRELVNASTIFLPCLENNLDETHSLVEKDPVEIFKSRKYHTVPTIIAYTDMLGASKTKFDIKNENIPLPFSVEKLLPNNLEFANDSTKQRVAEIVKDFYSDKRAMENAFENTVQNYIEYFNDVTFEYPIIKSAVCHAATSPFPTYLMRFSSKGQTKYNSGQSKCCNNLFEYFYEKDFSDEDRLTMERLVALWSNFIKIRDPTPLTTSLVPVVWQPVTAAHNIFDIKSVTGLIFGSHLQKSDLMAHSRIRFWDKIYKKVYRFHIK